MVSVMQIGSILRPTVSGLFVLIVTPVVGDFFVELARQRGLYNDPDGAMSTVANMLSTITSHPLYPYVLGVSLGVVIGVLAHWLATKRDKRGSLLVEDRKRQQAEERRKEKDADVRALGKECVSLAEDMFRFLSERAAENAARKMSSSENDMHKEWERDRAFEATTAAQFFQRFGSRGLGCVGRLRSHGIVMPPHMIATAQHSMPRGIPQILSALGGILELGQLEEAREVAKDQDFMWSIEH